MTPTPTHTPVVAVITKTPQPTFTPNPTATPTKTATPASTQTALPTETLQPTVTLPDTQGLILSSIRAERGWFVVKDDVSVALSQDEAIALGLREYGFMAHAGVGYSIKDGDVYKQIGDEVQQIESERVESDLFGVVGDWLLVSSHVEGDILGLLLGELTAIALDGSDYQIIDETPLYWRPIIAPDGSRVFYNTDEDEGTFVWYPDGRKERVDFGRFRSGSFSPDSSQIAFVYQDEVRIYGVDSAELITSTPFEPVGDWVELPVWHPNGQSIVITATANRGIRLLSLDGTISDFAGSYPAFSPDGHWLAVYRWAQDHAGVTLINLESEQQFVMPIEGIPVVWHE